MEYWDLYDAQRRPLNRLHLRGEPLQPGEYHIIVNIWVVNRRGELLLTLRAPEKPLWPNLWENTGGAVRAGEDSRTGAARELLEETGISTEAGELQLLGTICSEGRGAILDSYLLRRDVPLEEICLQPGETVDVRWASLRELEEIAAQGKLLGPVMEQLRRWQSEILGGAESC